MVDRIRSELVAPLVHDEMIREAARHRRALEARDEGPDLSAVAIRLGNLLIRAGCRLEMAGRRRAPISAFIVVPTQCVDLR